MKRRRRLSRLLTQRSCRVAPFNGPLPLQPWTCPHCAAVWHSGRQYCVDCGYGLAPQESSSRLTDNLQELRLAQELEGRTDFRQVGSAADMQVRSSERLRMHASASEMDDSALRRSFEAESALQAEVALLRERNAQLTT